MRIFTAVRHSLDPRYYYGGLWSGNFHPALRRLGHEVVESGVDLKPGWDLVGGSREHLAVRAEITQRVVDEVRAAHRRRRVDLFLSYFYDAHFDPDGFDEIHGLGVPTVNFYCNSIYQFDLVSAVAAKAGHSWHAEKHARDRYLAAGARPVWVQMAADPDVYRPPTHPARERAACFVGQRYADRDRLAAAVVRAGVPLDLYGAGWARPAGRPADAAADGRTAGRPAAAPGSVGSYIRAAAGNLRGHGGAAGLARTYRQWRHRRGSRSLDELLAAAARGRADDVSATFGRYEVVLNFSNVWADGRPGSPLIPHVRLRDFEAPMSGACLLTGHTDEIEEFFAPGREIDTYRTADELVDKARFYLARPTAAARLREAGRRRARRDHTWDRRFQELFRKTGLDR